MRELVHLFVLNFSETEHWYFLANLPLPERIHPTCGDDSALKKELDCYVRRAIMLTALRLPALGDMGMIMSSCLQMTADLTKHNNCIFCMPIPVRWILECGLLTASDLREQVVGANVGTRHSSVWIDYDSV
jgi:hypothetical protein